MPQIAIAFGAAFALAVVLTLAVRSAALRLGFVDHPDGDRKFHSGPTPDVGGVAVFLASALTLGAGLLLGTRGIAISPEDQTLVFALCGGATAIFLLGLLDDAHHLPARWKFLIELGIAGLVFAFGVRIDTLGPGGAFSLPFLISLPVTLLWLVGVANSFNLLDGSDGVAAGSALFALLTVGGASLLFGNEVSAIICFVLAGATLGFLLFNFPPASIFMGDSGSLFLGFSLAGLGIVATQKAPTILAVAVPIIAFGLPITDTALAVTRRFLRRDRIFQPDRGHIHHRLHDLGHSPRAVALVLYMVCAGLSLVSLALAGGTELTTAALFVILGIVMVVLIQRLRIPELMELGKIIHWGVVHRVVVERNVRIRDGVRHMAMAIDGPEIREALLSSFSNGEFDHVDLWVAHPLSSALDGLPGVEVRGQGKLLSMDLEDALIHPRHTEVRLPLHDDTGTLVGRLSLFRTLDGTRLATDLDLVSGELLPVLLEALERAASPQVRRVPGDPASASSGGFIRVEGERESSPGIEDDASGAAG
jgi:UDP-GlcNAc:undecaprenyl-phosphate GlcNAc-1-phosphate transferase